MELTYTSPIGSTVAVRESDEIIAILEASDVAYWKQGSGDGRLTFANDPLRRELTIMCRKPLGYHFLYSRQGSGARKKRVLYIALSGYDFSERSSLFIGGTFTAIPNAFFLLPPQARDVIRSFAADGSMSRNVIWERHPIGMGSDEIRGDPY